MDILSERNDITNVNESYDVIFGHMPSSEVLSIYSWYGQTEEWADHYIAVFYGFAL